MPWLKNQVEYKADETFVPNLPNTENPVLKEQLDYIDIYSGDFKNDWNIIGHSLWCQLALHFIVDNNLSNQNVVLVAPSYNDITKNIWEENFWESLLNLKEYYNTKINFTKLNKLNNNITIFLSKNDPYINLDSAKKFYIELKNVKFVEFEDKWHFNNQSETFELEEILKYIN
jgi:predicted alpha/beta hydrolase family esterase